MPLRDRFGRTAAYEELGFKCGTELVFAGVTELGRAADPDRELVPGDPIAATGLAQVIEPPDSSAGRPVSGR